LTADPDPTDPVSSVARRLAAAGCVAATDEAAAMVRAATDPGHLDAMIRRREAGEPLAWITGTTWFCGRPLVVDQGVFVPRPQTEELARRAAAVLPPGGRAADLCTGSGAVAAHLAATVPGARVVAVDIDERAVACARRNGVAAVRGDGAGPLRERSVDVVTAVAPYVPTAALRLLPADVQRHEPRRALDGGADGLAVVGAVVAGAAGLLRPGGSLLLEVGGEQEAAVSALMAAAGLAEVTPWHDDDGDLRGMHAITTG
jgi:release factor glutamine methyltransferase